MEEIAGARELVGYQTYAVERAAFRVTGYTLLVPAKASPGLIPGFWDQCASDGRLERLQACSSVPTPLLGLGSWDPECEPKGHRYTVCLEETEHTDLSGLAADYDLFTKQIGASHWLRFIVPWEQYLGRFWKDNPYKMMGKLGYDFYSGDDTVGLHFEAYAPGFSDRPDDVVDFWITVVPRP